ncbi:MAG: hypothetical protein IPI81_10665 [Flavobacteriales bacterium]|nr:hypothetical protein [Flavobacteriales bacterium]
MIQQDLAIASEDLMEYGRLKRANTKLTHDLYKQYVVFRTNKELNQELFNLNLWDGFYPDPSKVNAVGALRRKIAKRKRVLDQVPHHDLFNVQLLIAEYFSLLLMNQYKEAGECSSQLIKRGVSHLLRFMDEGEYLWHLNWGLTISLHTHDRALADQLIRSAQGFFQKLPTKRRNRSVVVNYHRFLNKMIAYHVHTDQFERAKEMIASMGAELTSEVTSPSIRKIFLINACQVHLCLGEAKQALNFYNRIYNDPGVNSVRVDIDPGVNVLGCAIFHELGSTSNLTSLIRHCMRARHYNKQTKAYKKLILLFKKLIAPMDEPKTRSLIIGVTAELQRIRVERDRTSLFFLENFRVMHWLPRIGSGKPVIR